MTPEPQKASTDKENAAAEERKNETKQTQARIQSEVEETAKNQTKAQETAQTQQNAQPEVENQPQGLNETQAPAAEPGAEDAVRERRIADEFVLICSDAALAHMLRTTTGDMTLLIAKAYVRIYRAEAVLCGAIEIIAPFGRVPPLAPNEKWWAPFELDGRWFKLQYNDTFIREYEIIPSVEPTPGDDDEPQPPQHRQQRRAPPQRIGPRVRMRRNGDPQGSRAAANVRRPEKPRKKAKKGKPDSAKRMINEWYNLVRAELEIRSEELSHRFRQLCDHTSRRLSEIRTHLLRSFDAMTVACGNGLSAWRDAVASIVQIDAFTRSIRKGLNFEREPAPETFGQIARLESCDAGNSVFSRLRLNSWKPDQPPTPWAEYIFGVDWTLNIFGVLQEEQAFT